MLKNSIRLFAATVLFSIFPGHGFSEGVLTVRDLAGRTVTLATPVQRVVLGEGRFLPTIGILDTDNPTKRIVGMMSDFEQYDPAGYESYRRELPEIQEIPRIGKASANSFSLEAAIALKPDMVLLGAGSGHSPGEEHQELLNSLEKAGIPAVFVDFRLDPLKNTPSSIALLGRLLGKRERAAEFIKYYRDALDVVKQRLASIDDRPSVFMEIHVGLRPECCTAMGRMMMGRFIEWAGGENVFGGSIPGTHGVVSLEHLLTYQPDYYIATAIGAPSTLAKFPKRVALGAGIGPDTAQRTLGQVRNRKGFGELQAITAGNAFSIWHNFYNTPMHVAAVQALAKWFHPSEFADISPEQTLSEYFKRFQPVPLDGTYWAQIER